MTEVNEEPVPPIQRTRYKRLGYQWFGTRVRGCWRIVDIQTESPIGPRYLYRCDLLADIDRVAEAFGY